MWHHYSSSESWTQLGQCAALVLLCVSAQSTQEVSLTDTSCNTGTCMMHTAVWKRPQNQNHFTQGYSEALGVTCREAVSGDFTKAYKGESAQQVILWWSSWRNQPLGNKVVAINIFLHFQWVHILSDMQAHTSSLTEWHFSYEHFCTQHHHLQPGRFCLPSYIPSDSGEIYFHASPGSALQLLSTLKRRIEEIRPNWWALWNYKALSITLQMKQSFICAASDAFKLCLNNNFMHKINVVFPSAKSNLRNAVFISVLFF